MSRRAVVAIFIAADLWQLFFGALTSLALANPAVSRDAGWVPNLLVAETWSLVPVGFLLCFWGTRAARILAALSGAASIGLAAVASLTVSARPLAASEVVVWLALLVVPGAALIVTAGRRRAREARGV